MRKHTFVRNRFASYEIIQKAVVEADSSGIVRRRTVETLRDFRPDDSRQAHGARLAGGVDDAVVEGEAAEFLGGVADGDHLCVGRRVVCLQDAVMARGDDFTGADYDGTKRAALSECDAW